ncbi:MAG: TonB-dependent receptor [Bacteroidota bacterium]
MRASFLFVSLFLLLPFFGLAQNSLPVRLVVHVVDSQAVENVPEATVELTCIDHPDSVLIKTTNRRGLATFRVNHSDRFYLRIQRTGYETIVQKIDIPPNLSGEWHSHHSLEPISTSPLLVSTNSGTEIERASISISPVTRRMMERYSGNTLSETIARLPGVTFANTGAGISKPVIRGQSFNRIAVVEMGIKQEGQQWGAEHGLEVDQNNVHHAKVLKGPTSLRYGSDAMAGVLVLDPHAPPPSGAWNAEVNSLYRSANHAVGTSVSAGANFGQFDAQFRFSTLDYGDLAVPADSFAYIGTVLPLENGQLKNTAGRERTFTGQVGYEKYFRRLHWQSRLFVSYFDQNAGMFAGSHGIPRFYQLTDDGKRRDIGIPYQDVRHLKIISRNELKLNDLPHRIFIDVGYQRNLRDEYSAPHAHGDQYVAEDSLALALNLQTLTLNARDRWTLSKLTQLDFGVQSSLQTNRIGGFEFLLAQYEQQRVGSYAILEHEINRSLYLSGGLRYDYGAVQVAPFTEIRRDVDFIPTDTISRVQQFERAWGSPSGSVGISWFPNEHWNLKANLGSAYRFPQAVELASNGVHHGAFRHEQGNQSLSPERGWQADLGFLFEKKRGLQAYKLSVTPFANYFSNYIYLTPTARFSRLPEGGQLYRYEENQALLWGGEVQAELDRLGPFNLLMAGEYLRSRNLDTRLYLPFQPPSSVMGALQYQPRLQGKWARTLVFEVQAEAFEAQDRTVRNEPATPGYWLLNAYAEWRSPWPAVPFRLNVQVLNVLDKRYLRHLSIYRILNLPEIGRSVNVRFTLPIMGNL